MPDPAGELFMRMDRKSVSLEGSDTHGIYSTPLGLALGEAKVRLLETLSCLTEARVMGAQIVREIAYRVLCGSRGGCLRALVAINGRLSQIQRALERMHAGYAQVIDVASLAGAVSLIKGCRRITSTLDVHRARC